MSAPADPPYVVTVVSSVEAEASGPSYSVPALAKALAGQGVASVMATIGENPSQRDGLFYDHRCKKSLDVSKLSHLWISPSLKHALADYARAGTPIFHVHGLWQFPNVYPMQVRRGDRPKIVLAPRGTLNKDALARSALPKKIFWSLFQKSALEAADMFHATSDKEYREIREFGITKPVMIVPNGIDLPADDTLSRQATEREILFLGRLHPIKRIENLLEAWTALQADYPDWRVRIVGVGSDTYTRSLQAAAQSFGAERVSFDGALYGKDKHIAYRRASLYVLPSITENFGMTVAESLAAGTPVITTHGTPWRGLEDQGCGWWVDHGPGALRKALEQALAISDDDRTMMGQNGRAWMADDFAWSAIAQKSIRAYQWLLVEAKRPDFVRLD